MTIKNLEALKREGFELIPCLTFYLTSERPGVKYETYEHGRERAEVINGVVNRVYEKPK